VLLVFRWASLAQSQLVYLEQVIGYATGYLSSDVLDNGAGARFVYNTIVSDNNQVQKFNTNNTAAWSSPAQAWTEAGDIAVISQTMVGFCLNVLNNLVDL